MLDNFPTEGERSGSKRYCSNSATCNEDILRIRGTKMTVTIRRRHINFFVNILSKEGLVNPTLIRHNENKSGREKKRVTYLWSCRVDNNAKTRRNLKN